MEDTIFTYVGSLGFPIVACIGLFYLYDKTIKELTMVLNEIKEILKNLSEDFSEHRNKMEDEKNA